MLRLLEAWGYLDGWALTDKGEGLVRIFHECDLLIAEALEAGLLDDLDPASLAGLVSCFTYEHRSSSTTARAVVPLQQGPRAGSSAIEQLAGELQRRRAAGRPAAHPAPGPRVRRARARLGGG